MRVDPVLLLGSAVVFGGALAVHELAGLACAGALTLLVRRAVRPALLVAVWLALLVGQRRALARVTEFETARIAARDAIGAPARCFGTAVVTEAASGVADAASARVRVVHMECEARRLPRGALARLYGVPGELRRGDRIEVSAQLAPVRLFRNLDGAEPTVRGARSEVVLSGAALSVVVVARRFGPTALLDAARAHARARIEATFAPPARAMARALVVGDTDLEQDEAEAFRNSGLSHILAVSGTHLVFAVLSIVQALTFLLVRIERLAARYDMARWSAAFGAVLALTYADFAGGSGSAWRAAWMLCAAFLARAAGRRPNGTRALGVSLLVGGAADELAAFDMSFLLSVAATAGLMYVGAPLARPVARVRPAPLRYLAQSSIATTSAMLACCPLLSLMSSELTLAGLAANLIAGPIGEMVALPLCLGHAALSSLPALEQGAAAAGSGALLLVKAVAYAGASASFLRVEVPEPNAWQVVLVIVCAGVVARAGTARAFTAALAVIAASGGLVSVERALEQRGRPLGALRLTMLDVDQGDATLVDLPDGSLMLVDAGGFVGSVVDPGKLAVLPALRARRRTRIDVVVLSHPHPDHFGGLLSIARAVPIGEFWDTGQGEAEGAGPAYAKLLEELRARRVPIRRPLDLCGEGRLFGRARLRVLGPCPAFVPHVDANDNSLVLRVELDRRAVLLTGDAEHDQEAELVRREPLALRADLLKVGHHGSRTSSTTAFLAAVRPRVATISSGVRNRFGHPHEEALSRLAGARAHALRLDRVGSVIWLTHGQRVELYTYSEAR